MAKMTKFIFGSFLAVMLFASSTYATVTPSSPTLGDVVTVSIDASCPSGENYRVLHAIGGYDVIVSSRACGSTFTIPGTANSDWVIGDPYQVQELAHDYQQTFTLATPPATGISVASVQDLVTDKLSDYGNAVLIILGALLGIAVAYLVFKFGWRKVKGSVK